MQILPTMLLATNQPTSTICKGLFFTHLPKQSHMGWAYPYRFYLHIWFTTSISQMMAIGGRKPRSSRPCLNQVKCSLFDLIPHFRAQCWHGRAGGPVNRGQKQPPLGWTSVSHLCMNRGRVNGSSIGKSWQELFGVVLFCVMEMTDSTL
jgi:hypothetical protein